MDLILFIFLISSLFMGVTLSYVEVNSGSATIIYETSPSFDLQISGLEFVELSDIKLELLIDNKTLDSLKYEIFRPADYKYFLTIKRSSNETRYVEISPIVARLYTSNDNFIHVSGRWATVSSQQLFVPLFLSSLKINNTEYIISNKIKVGEIIRTPTIIESETTFYVYYTKEIKVFGSFRGARMKYDAISFNVAGNYDDTRRNEVYNMNDFFIVQLYLGYNFEQYTGPLYVTSVNAGAETIKMPGNGVLVGYVKSERPPLTVLPVLDYYAHYLYPQTEQIVIKGSGFNLSRTELQFSNGILNGVHYTTVNISLSEIHLKLVPGFEWVDIDVADKLIMTGVDVGNSFINAGATIDTIVAHFKLSPIIEPSDKIVFCGETVELEISGDYFTQHWSESYDWTAKVLFSDTTYKQDLQFSVFMHKGNEKLITINFLYDDYHRKGQCAHQTGPLYVTAINLANGDEDLWVYFPGKGVQVANVQPFRVAESIGFSIDYNDKQRIYQSVLNESITVTGKGFVPTMVFQFFTPMLLHVDYEMEFINKNKVILHLKEGKKWTLGVGISSVQINGVYYKMNTVVVAAVSADPIITPSDADIFEFYYQIRVPIQNCNLKQITLNPTPETVFSVNIVDINNYPQPNTRYLQLTLNNSYSSWLPSTLSFNYKPSSDVFDDDLPLTAADVKIPLQITSIDCGAGLITYNEPIPIGSIVKDPSGKSVKSAIEHELWTIAGKSTRTNFGGSVSTGDGKPAKDGTFLWVDKIWGDSSGSIYVRDGYDDRLAPVRVIDADTGVINQYGHKKRVKVEFMDSNHSMYSISVWNAGDILKEDVYGNVTQVYRGKNRRQVSLKSLWMDPSETIYGVRYNWPYSFGMIDRIANNVSTRVAGVDCTEYNSKYECIRNDSPTFGDGGPATSAELPGIKAVAFDLLGNMYLALSYDSKHPYFGHVRKVNLNTGIISSRILPVKGVEDSNLLGWRYNVVSMWVDTAANLIVADQAGLIKMFPYFDNGEHYILADGSHGQPFYYYAQSATFPNGINALQASFGYVKSMWGNTASDLYVSCSDNTVRVLRTAGLGTPIYPHEVMSEVQQPPVSPSYGQSEPEASYWSYVMVGVVLLVFALRTYAIVRKNRSDNHYTAADMDASAHYPDSKTFGFVEMTTIEAAAVRDQHYEGDKQYVEVLDAPAASAEAEGQTFLL